MIDYTPNNKEYLLSLKPKYNNIPYILIISIFIILIVAFNIHIYDTYKTKGYIYCEDTCHIIITTSLEDTNKLNNIQFIELNKQKIEPEDTIVSEIKTNVDTQNNYQIIDYKVARLDGLLNTYQDITIFTNYEKVISKLKQILLK